jgi:hypothetical protein
MVKEAITFAQRTSEIDTVQIWECMVEKHTGMGGLDCFFEKTGTICCSRISDIFSSGKGDAI